MMVMDFLVELLTDDASKSVLLNVYIHTYIHTYIYTLQLNVVNMTHGCVYNSM